MKERVAFGAGTGVILLGIALVMNSVAQLQTGPGWEIPSTAATNWTLFGLISIALHGIGVICYMRGNRFASLSAPALKGFWILLCVGLLITASSCLLEPGQWQVTHRDLSAVVRKSSVPAWGLCGIVWMLLIVWTRRTPSMDA